MRGASGEGRSTIRISITRLKLVQWAGIHVSVRSINHKNLDYEIETCHHRSKGTRHRIAINHKNLDYEIETSVYGDLQDVLIDTINHKNLDYEIETMLNGIC